MEADCAKLVAEACRLPTDAGIPVTQWSIRLLGEYVRAEGWDTSNSTVHRVLQDANLQPHRQKMWLTSHDDEFRAKRDDVLHLYYDTPADEHIICVDEKPGMQALERRYPDLPMAPGSPVRCESEYIRHGTLALMGAFDVRRGKLFGFVSEDHDSSTFIDLLNAIDACYPEGCGHIVCDNHAMHTTEDVLDWLDDHPRWTLHFTPKHASWLNQIECAFSILQRRVIARGSFTSLDDLRNKVYDFLLWFNNRPDRPFHWTYRPKSWGTNCGQTSGTGN